MADIEDRRKRLERLRAEREAREKEAQALVNNASSPAKTTAPAPVAAASPAAPAAQPSSTAPRDSSPNRPPQKITTEIGIATVSIEPVAPAANMGHDRTVMTDHVFVYDEARPDPNDASGSQSVVKAAKPTSDDTPNDSFVSAPVEKQGFQPHPNCDSVLASQNFKDFLMSANLVVGDSLRSNDLQTLDAAVGLQSNQQSAVEVLSITSAFFAPVAKDKVVTGIGFQPQSAEFFCASYTDADTVQQSVVNEGGDGTVLVWSTHRSHTHPTFTFTCPDEVSTVSYAKYHPSLIIGGTFSGRVVLWDQRASSRPVSISFPSSDSHTMSVFNAAVVGREVGSALISASTDGRLCTWNVEKPRHPTSCTELHSVAGGRRTGRIANSIAVEDHEALGTSRVYVGGADGTLYSGTHTSNTARRLELRKIAKSHEGAITSLHTHPMTSDSRFAGLVLSASMDWTCRLWRDGATASLDFEDFVYDAKWSPTNPVVFAAGDGAGCVNLWNLAESVDAPVHRLSVTESPDSTVGKGTSISITKIAWDHTGENLIVGTSHGECFLVNVNKSHVAPSRQQMERFAEVLGNTLVNTN